MSEQNIMLNQILDHIQYFIKNYEKEKYNLRIDRFNKKNKTLAIAYREYTEQYVPIYTTYNQTNIKITQFKIIVKLNEKFNKINNIKFMDNNEKLYTINNNKINMELINKLEKDLITAIGCKKNSIKSIIDYNNFVKTFNHVNNASNTKYKNIDTNSKEKLSLLNNATDCFNEIASNVPFFE